MKIESKILALVLASVLIGAVAPTNSQQVYAPRGCSGCDNQTIDDGNTTISTSATEAALKGSEKQKQLMNDKEVLLLNQSESSSLNMTDINGSTLGKQ